MEKEQIKKESKFKQLKRNIFMSMVRKRSTKEYDEMIKKIEEQTGEKPDITVRKIMRKEILESNAKKMERRVVITATAVFLAGSIGIGTGHALNEGSGKIEGVTKTENGINIDKEEIDGEIVIDLTNQESSTFRDILRVTDNNEIVSEHGTIENEMIDLYELRSNIIQEVEALETEDDRLNYVKEEYVEEYNKTHEEKISVENVILYRSTENINNTGNIIYRDTAINGEEINRVCSYKYAEEHNLKQAIGASGEIIHIRVDGKVQEIAVGFYGNNFRRGYDEKEEVQELVEDSISERIGNLLNAGIKYAKGEGDKNELINAMVEYRQREIEEIIKGQLLDQEDSKDGRKSNDFEIGE